MAQFRNQIWANIIKPNGLFCSIAGIEYQWLDLNQFAENHLLSFKEEENSLIGVVIRNDFETYAALLLCWMSGKGYVPIQPNYPNQRIKDILETSEITSVFDSKDAVFAAEYGLKHINSYVQPTPLSSEISSVSLDSNAYVLFTSGTTGKPKGVPISWRNLQAFIDGFFELGYSLGRSDRFLQMFELTFDLSVMSFSIPSIIGASFHALDPSMIKPLALYDALDSQNISFALMVPSAVEMLAPYADDIELPHLKVTQFCGEAFRLNQFNIWKNCVPHSQIDNVYGPTEATIYCSRYTAHHPNENIKLLHQNGVVCIGIPMKTVKFHIDDNQELCLGGHQTTHGYLNATPEQTEKFFHLDDVYFYKSGDIAVFEGNNYFCHGRMDDQVKIQGYRIELSELEFAGSKVFENCTCKAVALSQDSGSELHLFVLNTEGNFHENESETYRKSLNALLPDYMAVKAIHLKSNFPLNDNGKIDKKQLIKSIE